MEIADQVFENNTLSPTIQFEMVFLGTNAIRLMILNLTEIIKKWLRRRAIDAPSWEGQNNYRVVIPVSHIVPGFGRFFFWIFGSKLY